MIPNSRFTVGIHILTALAYNCDKPLTSEVIATSVTTNPVVIRRVLGDLRRAGLVLSQPGNRGGWRLTREPDQITLRDAYNAVQQGPLFAPPPRAPNPQCPIGKTICIALSGFFAEAEDAMKNRLAERTLADVLMHVQEGARK
jgi:Rrf2 family protein